MTSHHEAAREAAEKGLTRLITALAVIVPCIALAHVLANAGDYRQPATAIVIWLAVAGVGAWLVRRLRAGGLSPAETATAIAVAVAAVAAIGLAHRSRGASGSVDLAVLGTVWLLVLVAMSHSARVWVPAALLVFAVQGGLLIHAAGLNSPSLSRLAAAGYIVATVLAAFAALRPALDARADAAARQSAMVNNAATERAATAVIRQERRGRLAMLERDALPLLRGIAEGTLDPADPDVRRECARQAEALRRSLAGTGTSGDLVAGLQPALRAAAARALPVTVQVVGDPGAPPPPVARAVAAAVGAVLGGLAPQQAMLTVIAAEEDTELYLTFGARPEPMPDLARLGLDVPAAARWRAAVHTGDANGGYLEVSWRRDGAD